MVIIGDAEYLRAVASIRPRSATKTRGTVNLDFPGQFVLLLDRGVVTERLRALRETITGAEKEIIYADTLRCLETGTYRAAIVMGWNLAYEHRRRWVFKSKRKRLKEFNAELTTRLRTKNDTDDPIKDYEDFYELREAMVIEIAHKVKLFDKQKLQVLTGALNERNHFTHPSSRKTTAASATGYIENLIVNILDDQHLAYGWAGGTKAPRQFVAKFERPRPRPQLGN